MDFTNKTYFLNYIKFCGILGALIGLVFGIFYSFGGLMIDTVVSLNLLSPSTMGTPGLGTGTILAFGALIGMPAMFSVGSIVLGIIFAGGYNFVHYFKH